MNEPGKELLYYMRNEEILSRVDHTLLKPDTSWESIVRLCEEAEEYHTASVCIPPCYVRRVRERFEKLVICTVIGFPLGYSVTAAKVAETAQAVLDGADEIDMVVNITDVKNHRYEEVENEIRAVREACREQVLKVIVETCYLTEEEKIAVCEAVTKAGADYIKTSTGFGTAGAAIEDVRLFREHIGPEVKIKAAGGIRTREALEAFLAEGCDRVGASCAVELFRK